MVELLAAAQAERGDDGVGGQVPRQGVEDRRGGHTAAPVVRGAARLFRAPDGPPGRHVGSLVLGVGLAQAIEQPGQGELGVPDHPGSDRVEAAMFVEPGPAIAKHAAGRPVSLP